MFTKTPPNAPLYFASAGCLLNVNPLQCYQTRRREPSCTFVERSSLRCDCISSQSFSSSGSKNLINLLQILALPSLAWIKMRKLPFLRVARVTKGSWCDSWMCNCLYLWWCNKNNCWCPFSVHISEVRKVHFFSFRSKGFNEKVCLEEIFTSKQMHLMFFFIFCIGKGTNWNRE